MSNSPSVSSIVTSIADFEQLVIVAKRQGLTALRLGDIEFHLLPTESKTEILTRSDPTIDVNAEAYDAYRNL